MAGPSVGTFSSPTAFGRYISLSSGPRNTYFMSHQNKGVTSPDRPRPRGFRYPNTLVPTGSRRANPSHAGIRASRMDVHRRPDRTGRGGGAVRAVPGDPAVPTALPPDLT